MSATRILRERVAALDAALDRSAIGGMDGSAAAVVVTATKTTYPTVAAQYYACHPIWISGNTTEGTAATYHTDTATWVYAVNLGTAIPPSGTKILTHSVGGRWVFRFDG
jgi:hypothetical protein